jgi:hypothetical protein
VTGHDAGATFTGIEYDLERHVGCPELEQRLAKIAVMSF